jgi:post-segregation antitoxin (ccd killing protein)
MSSTETIRNGKIYHHTCVSLPYEIHQEAKRRGINFSRTLTKALETKLRTITPGVDIE